MSGGDAAQESAPVTPQSGDGDDNKRQMEDPRDPKVGSPSRASEPLSSATFASLHEKWWWSQDGPGGSSNKRHFKVQSVAKKPMDLMKLWNEVNRRGGYSEVKDGKLWATVGKIFNPPHTCTNLSYIVKKCYEECLLALENTLRSGTVVEGITLPEVANQMELMAMQMNSNKVARDAVGRRIKVYWPRYVLPTIRSDTQLST
mmetsp:Transcript_2182/g.5050  ORF Transcript_2182/g.5050 Transcript_2182/m.5050 type:complete len:202 (+) Transcript_2182:1584-2189(+)